MDTYLLIVFFALGLIIGSFLNVVIYRLNTKKSLGGRSACMSCQSKLRWYELVPLFSFVGLMGRCRTCKTKISIQYPLVELATGIIFSALFLKIGGMLYFDLFTFSISYAYYAFLFSVLIVIAAYDLKHKIIPDSLSFIFGALAFVGLFFFQADGLYFHIPSGLDLLSGVIIASPFAIFWLISGGRWMGLGDAKLALGIGWLLHISLALSALVIAFWSGAIVGIFLIAFSRLGRASGNKNGIISRMGMKSEIPFAPFLVLGTIIAFFLELNFFGI